MDAGVVDVMHDARVSCLAHDGRRSTADDGALGVTKRHHDAVNIDAEAVARQRDEGTALHGAVLGRHPRHLQLVLYLVDATASRRGQGEE